MKRIWLDSYPEGVPHDVDTSIYSSVLDIFKKSCEEYSSKKAYTSLGHSVTFSEVELLTEQFACYLQHDLGLKKGDRIGIMLPNVIQYPVAVFSALRLGLVIVNIDPMYTQRELVSQFNDSGAQTVIVLESFAHEVEKALEQVDVKNVIVTKIGDCLPKLNALYINMLTKHVKKAVPNYELKKAIFFRKAVNKYKGNTSRLEEVTVTLDDSYRKA